MSPLNKSANAQRLRKAEADRRDGKPGVVATRSAFKILKGQHRRVFGKKGRESKRWMNA